MSKKPKAVELTLEQTEALKQRILLKELTDSDKELLVGLISFNLWLREQLSLAKLSIKKLKGLFGFSTEKKKSKETDDVDKTDSTVSNNNDKTTDIKNSTVTPTPKTTPKQKPKWSANANHGRYGYDDYPGLETVTFPHETLKPGDSCPQCVEANLNGKLSPLKTGSYIRLVGSPIVTGTRYVEEGYRCNLCSETYKPDIPKEIIEAPKYSADAISSIAVNHYYMSMPFKRIEMIQASAGIPLPDATQYDKMIELKNKLKPLFSCMLEMSINSHLIHYDDTLQRILESGNNHGTAIVSRHEDYWIYLYYTSQHCAGKEVSQLLKNRASNEPLVTMVDGSNQNHLTEADETLLSRLIVAYCLVHGRRKFYKLLDDFPEICGVVIEAIAKIYRHEAYCRNNQLSAEARLAYHQKHSAPVMEALHVYLTNLWQYNKTIEHNSPLGNAIQYMLRRWAGLTRFLQVEGCPIDNNICEQAIKVLIRYRKNSLFYRTLQGAMCGDTIMSVIHTAVRNKINPFEYLTVLQEYETHVALNPEAFLPWNYQTTLEAMAIKKAA